MGVIVLVVAIIAVVVVAATGGLAAFTVSFPADTGSRTLAVGDEVTVRVRDEDETVDMTGVMIEDGRRRFH